MPFSSGEKVYAHRDGGRVFVDAGLFLVCSPYRIQEGGSFDGLYDIAAMIVDCGVGFVASVVLSHLLEARGADVFIIPCF